jgi:hypothetical protein
MAHSAISLNVLPLLPLLGKVVQKLHTHCTACRKSSTKRGAMRVQNLVRNAYANFAQLFLKVVKVVWVVKKISDKVLLQ